MARKRTIQPNIWQDEGFGLLKPLAQLIYIGCITQADDDGRLIGHPAVIKSMLFPYGLVTLEEVFDSLEELNAQMKNFIYYEVDKNYFIQFKNWEKHQKQQKERRQNSIYPSPTKEVLLSKCLADAKQPLSQVSKEVSKKVSSSGAAAKNKVLDELRKSLENQGVIKKTKLL